MNSDLLLGWRLEIPWWMYVFLTLTLSLLVRILSSLLKALEQYLRSLNADDSPQKASFGQLFRTSFKGFGATDSGIDDYWFPFLIGWFELSLFPILMRSKAWEFIGAWLALKTLAQWETWNKNRPAFNRFLIGTAAVVTLSFLVARRILH
jgi:hypothetical protein